MCSPPWLIEPVRLSFAGEHTAPEMGALMEGALRSGVRAARMMGEPPARP